MKDRSIIFRGDGVLAILEDRKTNSRRVIKFPPNPGWQQAIEHQALKVAYPAPLGGWVFWDDPRVSKELSDHLYRDDKNGLQCPYGQPGDRLYVKETWAPMCRVADPFCACDEEAAKINHYIEYKADTGNPFPGDWPEENRDDEGCPKWRPSIFMPRRASRITLEIVSVRVERLQSISAADAFAEGISGGDWLGDPVGEFAKLWNSINEKRGFGWETNCWIWVLEFKRVV